MILVVVAIFLTSVSVVESEETLNNCTMVDPTCGSDGKLYYSLCELISMNKNYNITLVEWADCKVDCNKRPMCTMEYIPHCGTDGVIYGNGCSFLWANCGKPDKVKQDFLANCVNELCADDCVQDGKECHVCQRRWSLGHPWVP